MFYSYQKSRDRKPLPFFGSSERSESVLNYYADNITCKQCVIMVTTYHKMWKVKRCSPSSILTLKKSLLNNHILWHTTFLEPTSKLVWMEAPGFPSGLTVWLFRDTQMRNEGSQRPFYFPQIGANFTHQYPWLEQAWNEFHYSRITWNTSNRQASCQNVRDIRVQNLLTSCNG